MATKKLPPDLQTKEEIIARTARLKKAREVIKHEVRHAEAEQRLDAIEKRLGGIEGALAEILQLLKK